MCLGLSYHPPLEKTVEICLLLMLLLMVKLVEGVFMYDHCCFCCKDDSTAYVSHAGKNATSWLIRRETLLVKFAKRKGKEEWHCSFKSTGNAWQWSLQQENQTTCCASTLSLNYSELQLSARSCSCKSLSSKRLMQYDTTPGDRSKWPTVPPPNKHKDVCL